MKKVGCTSRELMPESEYKELHRAEIVDKIFTNLEKRSDSGIGQFRCMLKELTEWNYFDPYYFQKLNKLSESEAKRNISHLKQLQEIRDYKIKQERQRQEERRKRKVQAHTLRICRKSCTPWLLREILEESRG